MVVNILHKANWAGGGALALWAMLALFSVQTSRIPPFQLLFISFILASLVGAIIIKAQGKSFALLKQPPLVWLHGIYGLFLYHLCYFMALRLLPPATALLINALWALLIVVFASFLPQGRLQKNHLIGALLGLFALSLLVGGIDLGRDGAIWGVVLALLCAFIWSSYSVMSRLFQAVPTESLCGFCFATALLALFAHLGFEKGIWDLTLKELFSVVVLGVGPTGLAFYLWDYATKHGNLSLLGALSYAAPVSGTLLLVIFGHQPASWILFFSLGLILLGGFIATKAPSS